MHLKSNRLTGNQVCISHPKALPHQKTLLDQKTPRMQLSYRQEQQAYGQPSQDGVHQLWLSVSLEAASPQPSAGSSVAVAGDSALLLAFLTSSCASSTFGAFGILPQPPLEPARKSRFKTLTSSF